ncbi:MAG: NAD(+) synthase [Clostridia bacterium]|nr:NAD(+) synthase [Clostridia bacterium]
MRNYQQELEQRVSFIRTVLEESGARGIVYGNSGGKDSALVGILCKAACDNTVGIMLPCSTRRNYSVDMDDALEVARQFHIETRTVDLTPVREAMIQSVTPAAALNDGALANIAPRLRMTALYAVAAAENRLVAGTGNRSEAYVGYFTKWGDGAHDFNPIADLTVTEIYAFLRYLHAPEAILTKAPSAALFDGQTDETEMGVTYAQLDAFLAGESIDAQKARIIRSLHERSEHKRRAIRTFAQ